MLYNSVKTLSFIFNVKIKTTEQVYNSQSSSDTTFSDSTSSISSTPKPLKIKKIILTTKSSSVNTTDVPSSSTTTDTSSLSTSLSSAIIVSPPSTRNNNSSNNNGIQRYPIRRFTSNNRANTIINLPFTTPIGLLYYTLYTISEYMNTDDELTMEPHELLFILIDDIYYDQKKAFLFQYPIFKNIIFNVLNERGCPITFDDNHKVNYKKWLSIHKTKSKKLIDLVQAFITTCLLSNN
ncbi:unnamed protein product [Cunninghamella blakesleeana]